MSELLKKPIVWPEVPDHELPGVYGSTLYARLAEYRQRDWEEYARAYEADPEDFYTAWQWLQHHPAFWFFAGEVHERSLMWARGIDEGVEFKVVKVNPRTGDVEEDRELNTKTEVRVEIFPPSFLADGGINRLHDYDVDCAGDSYEEAVINVAHNLYTYYGNDRRRVGELGHC